MLAKKQTLKCEKCKFVTESNDGLEVHIQRKHKNLDDPLFDCEFCDKTFKNKEQLEKHLKTHSFKKVFKCENCSFLGSNELCLNVHEGKEHSEEYECGLCDFKAGSLENLETHLHTCEIYTCCHYLDDNCQTVTDIKKHLKEKHTNWLKNTFVTHSKISRTDINLVETKHIKGSTFFSNN